MNPQSLIIRVGYNGPGFAYNWNDPQDKSVNTRYRLTALDDSYNILIELKNIYAVPSGDGDWKYVDK